MLIVSPHLDDAVFSCGQLLAANPGSIVLTVLAGVPSPDQPRTEWDAECGFPTAAGAVRARLEEDDLACALVRAQPVRLELLDGQYERAPDHVARLRAELRRLITAHRSHVLFVPLGIRHPDHIEVGTAARDVAQSLGIDPVVYEELPYRVEEPDEHARAQERWAAEGWTLEPQRQELGPLVTKHAAIDCYASQAAQFSREHLVAEERYLAASRRDVQPPLRPSSL